MFLLLSFIGPVTLPLPWDRQQMETYLLELSPLEQESVKNQVVSMEEEEAQFLEDGFHQLEISQTDKKLISYIISSMAEKNMFQLGLQKKSLEKRGKQIEHVHPLKFLSFLFSQPHLRQAMQEIRTNYFKWNGFMDGLSKKLDSEANAQDLLPYVEGFATSLNVDSRRVAYYLEKKDWEALVVFLMNN